LIREEGGNVAVFPSSFASKGGDVHPFLVSVSGVLRVSGRGRGPSIGSVEEVRMEEMLAGVVAEVSWLAIRSL
jgi:hypothetical protein